MSSDSPATRRRPTHRKGRATLTRESVGRAALDFLGRHGPAALTMRSLATELGVSPRALYNYVEDRRDLITVAAEIFEADWRPPPLDPSADGWRDSLDAFCRDLRAHYRAHPGMTTLALRENITAARHPTMLTNVEGLIGFYAEMGMSLPDAYLACMETLRVVIAFVEFEDVLHDHPPAHLPTPPSPPPSSPSPQPPSPPPFPPPWLTTADHPHLARLASITQPTPDEVFAFTLATLTEGLAARLPDTA
ncbi:TetR/AcrR family transcriptional regulator [Streptomyces iconiensis]|uniref:TetR/AcrR family transcriptional regulator n=1 Tax=Streptomyces iconiensis TaxID=1384038 RepID=A0ABT7AB06_9ACTN|nr:TetR/AcrR family transcriptional regulator [Streptomyces iconiensis]MDJ1138528.1 TetR/AcrR family transcriptional regulator [Streptomyces iconiensis]